MKVSVIVLNWNGGAADCLECIESVLAQDYRDRELIFVDNGSTDGSLQTVQRTYPSIHYLALAENLGCPEGRNRGAEIASGDLLMFLENDGAWATKDVISGVVCQFKRYPRLAALYTRVEAYQSGKTDSPLDSRTKAANELVMSSSFRGGASAIRAALFREVGGFPGEYMYGGEERYLSWRIYERGYIVAYWPERSMRHKGSDYSGKSAMRIRNMFVNDITTILRLYPFSWMFWYLPAKVILYGIRFMRQKRLGEFWAALHGIYDARPWCQRTEALSVATLLRVNSIRYSDNSVLSRSIEKVGRD